MRRCHFASDLSIVAAQSAYVPLPALSFSVDSPMESAKIRSERPTGTGAGMHFKTRTEAQQGCEFSVP